MDIKNFRRASMPTQIQHYSGRAAVFVRIDFQCSCPVILLGFGFEIASWKVWMPTLHSLLQETSAEHYIIFVYYLVRIMKIPMFVLIKLYFFMKESCKTLIFTGSKLNFQHSAILLLLQRFIQYVALTDSVNKQIMYLDFV